MGKKVKLVIGAATVILAGTIVTSAIASGTADPGSVDDPIVTKSYVDQQISQLKSSMHSGGTGTVTPGEVAPIIVEALSAGDILIGQAGTEIIVRGGETVAYGDGANGLPDVTGGVDIAIGKPIPTNHLLLLPRADGRGIKVKETFTGTAYIMIRGPFEVIKAK